MGIQQKPTKNPMSNFFSNLFSSKLKKSNKDDSNSNSSGDSNSAKNSKVQKKFLNFGNIPRDASYPSENFTEDLITKSKTQNTNPTNKPTSSKYENLDLN